MIIKLIFGIILVAVSSLVGIKLADKKRFIKDFFENLKNFNSELSADVGLYYTPLEKKLDEFNRKADGVIDGYGVIFSGESFDCKDKRLNKLQREFISEYVNSLGKFDEKNQIKYQDKTDKRIESFLESSKAVFKKYSALSVKLAFCFGLTVFIIIV